MGALLSSAVAGLRCPEEANLRAPESVLERASRLHPRGRRADRDEHVRREPGQARAPVPRRRARGDQRRRRAHRARGARGLRPRRLHRGLDRPARRRRAARPRPGGALRRAGARARGPRRRPLHGRDVLRPRRARDGDRRRALGLGAADRRAPHLRRRRRDARRREGGGRGGAPAAARPRRVRREPRRRAGRRAHGARADGRRRRRARGAAERRPREHDRPADRLPARDARVLRASSPRRRARSARA